MLKLLTHDRDHVITLRFEREDFPPMTRLEIAKGKVAVALYAPPGKVGEILISDQAARSRWSWCGKVVASGDTRYAVGEEVMTLPMAGKIMKNVRDMDFTYNIIQFLGFESDEYERECVELDIEEQLLMIAEQETWVPVGRRYIGWVDYHDQSDSGLYFAGLQRMKFDSTCRIISASRTKEGEQPMQFGTGDRVLFSANGSERIDGMDHYYPDFKGKNGCFVIFKENAVIARV